LEKEYECMKLYLKVESNKMKSFQLYKEYSKLNGLYKLYKPFKIESFYDYDRREYDLFEDIRFVFYFTKSKIIQLQNELELIEE